MQVKVVKVPVGVGFGHPLGSTPDLQDSVAHDYIARGWCEPSDPAPDASQGRPDPSKGPSSGSVPTSDPSLPHASEGHKAVEGEGMVAVEGVVKDRAVRTRDATKKG